MSILEFSNVWHGTLRAATFRIGPGLHVVLGTPKDGRLELIELAAGIVRPRRGRVTLDGASPHTNPALRGRIGALLSQEQLFPARTLGASLTRALELRRQERARDVLDGLGLGGWVTRPLASLSEREHRSAALALALATPEPALVALDDPLGGVAAPAASRLPERLAALAEHACVLVATSSVRDAVLLGGTLWLLGRSGLARAPAAAPVELAPGAPAHFVVRTTEARRLATRLCSEPAVAGIDWDDQRRAHEVHVRGDEPSEVALAIARAARAENVSVAAIQPMLPPLDVVQAASSGALQAAYEQGYRATLRRASAAAHGGGLAARPVYAGGPAPPNTGPEGGSA